MNRRSYIERIIQEELSGTRYLNEELSTSDFEVLRKFIRREVALIYFDLFKKRSTWT